MTGLSASRVCSLSLLISLSNLAAPALSSDAFLTQTPGLVSITDVESSLASELAGNVSEERLAKLETRLRPTYDALPKGPGGRLGHQTVRYVLHRLFVQRHSWYMKGLEPSDDAPPPYLGGEWVPAYLQGLIEQRLGGKGINLRELAALSAALEDLASREAAGWLESVYNGLRLSVSEGIGRQQAHNVLATYMMIYLDGAKFTKPNTTPESLALELQLFAGSYTDWAEVQAFLNDVEDQYLGASGDIAFATMAHVVDLVGERFGAFNDGECHSLKTTLLEIEDAAMPGRVRLSDFYKKGLYSHWQFSEKVSYLRSIGALDESNPNVPRVIMANYMSSESNCLEASSLYSVCCPNECEDLMGHLEQNIAAPMSEPRQISQLVATLSSDTSPAPQNLSATLIQRLGEIAQGNGGKVPIHGRLFAQWMHHAFPRECPYPHETGSKNVQTPDEWMDEESTDGNKASEEEMRWYMSNGTCGNSSLPCAAGFSAEEGILELPWSNVEELLVPLSASSAPLEAASFGRSSLRGSAALLGLSVLGVLAALPLAARKYGLLESSSPDGSGELSSHALECAMRVDCV